jgi:FxLD family lantipeptide
VDADLLSPGDGGDEQYLDLDVRFADIGPALTELMNSTSDNCGSTIASACVGCAAVS